MSNNAELQLLCQKLVANEFETIHDAEQALEQFEKLTTPELVLNLLSNEADQQDQPYLFALAADRMGCTLDIDGQAYHYVEDSRVESLLLDAARYRFLRRVDSPYAICTPGEAWEGMVDSALDTHMDASIDGTLGYLAPRNATDEIVARNQSN